MFLERLNKHRLGTAEIENLAKGIVYGGRWTYEFKKVRVNNINVERENIVPDIVSGKKYLLLFVYTGVTTDFFFSLHQEPNVLCINLPLMKSTLKP